MADLPKPGNNKKPALPGVMKVAVTPPASPLAPKPPRTVSVDISCCLKKKGASK